MYTVSRASKAQKLTEHPLPIEIDYVINTAIQGKLYWHFSDGNDGSFRVFVVTELVDKNTGKLGVGLQSRPYKDEDGELAHDLMAWGWFTHAETPQTLTLTPEAVMDIVYVSPNGQN